jgi:Lectin C-type domain/Gametolysin peptidase M11
MPSVRQRDSAPIDGKAFRMKRNRVTDLMRGMALLMALVGQGCGDSSISSTGPDSEIEGDLEVFIINRGDGASATDFSLRTSSDTSVHLDFPQPPALATGDRIRARGRAVDDRFFVEGYSVLTQGDASEEAVERAGEALTGNPVRRRTRLAVLMVHWGTPDAQTVAGMRGRMFTNNNSTSAFYAENSQNLFAMEGDVFGWFEVPAMTGCDYRTLASNAKAAARTAGVDLDGYNQFLYYFPRTSQCQWAGLASVGKPSRPSAETWYNGASGCVVLAQEILHNFGAAHSHSYTCTSNGAGVPLAGPSECTYSEYGDPYDPMGSGCFQINMYQKAGQGWLGRCNAVTLTSDAEFDLVPTELPSDAIQTLRVPVSSNLCPSGLSSCYYYVEYRQPIGIFDSASPTSPVHQGILVHIGPGTDFLGVSRPSSSYLLDMTPGSSRGFRDAALTEGQTYVDPAGIRITLVSRTSENARVRVQFPNGGSGAPTCIDGSQPTGGGTTPPPPPPPSNCGAGETEFEGSCYALTTTTQAYDSARSSCQARGAGWGLVEINSAAENNFVSGLVGTKERWIGANDRTVEGQFSWESGMQFWSGGATGAPVAGSYANFVTGEPNDNGGNSDCVRVLAGGGWRDGPCTALRTAVCERR